MKFAWDIEKADINRRKHGVEFDEATTIFGDPLAGTFPDVDHSLGEFRFITLGKSSTGQLPGGVTHRKCGGIPHHQCKTGDCSREKEV